MFALNLDTDGRVLSVCECIEGVDYDIVVDSFPDDNVRDYKYINGEFIHDPELKPEKEPTAEEDTLAMLVDHEERLIALELGMIE